MRMREHPLAEHDVAFAKHDPTVGVVIPTFVAVPDGNGDAITIVLQPRQFDRRDIRLACGRGTR